MVSIGGFIFLFVLPPSGQNRFFVITGKPRNVTNFRLKEYRRQACIYKMLTGTATSRLSTDDVSFLSVMPLAAEMKVEQPLNGMG